MMQEELIRRKTLLILDAYRELAGSGYMPSLGDFLLLRKAAVKEAGSAGLPVGETAGRPEPVRDIKPAAAVSVAPPPVRMETKEKAGLDKGPEPVKRDVKQESPATQTKREERPSDYDILRRIADPWN